MLIDLLLTKELFDGRRRAVPSGRMQPLPVIPDFNTLKELLAGLVVGELCCIDRQISFERLEPDFSKGIIRSIALAAHALGDHMRLGKH